MSPSQTPAPTASWRCTAMATVALRTPRGWDGRATRPGVLVGNVAGDQVADIVTIDRATRTVSAWITPGGDQRISADATARNLVARGEHALWSRQVAEHAYRLVEWAPGTIATDLPVADSALPYRPRIGRDATGALIAAYVRCSSVCLPYIWDFATRQELPFTGRVQAGCTIDDLAIWGPTVVYVCKRAGLWLRTGEQAPRRLTAHLPARGVPGASSLADLFGEDILWWDNKGYSSDLKLTRVSGRTRRIDHEDDGTVEDNATIAVTLSESEIYELVTYRGAGTALFRMKRCQRWLGSDEDLEGIASSFTYDLAVDGDRILYTSATGVWLTDPTRVRFRKTGVCGIT